MPQLTVCQRASKYHLKRREAPYTDLTRKLMSFGGRHPPHLRHNPIYIAAKLPLRVPASEPHEEIAESQQVNWAEGRAAGGNPSKLVYRIDVGQIGRNRAQPPLVVTVGDPILAPMAAPADRVE